MQKELAKTLNSIFSPLLSNFLLFFPIITSWTQLPHQCCWMAKAKRKTIISFVTIQVVQYIILILQACAIRVAANREMETSSVLDSSKAGRKLALYWLALKLAEYLFRGPVFTLSCATGSPSDNQVNDNFRLVPAEKTCFIVMRMLSVCRI